uniref:Uncharacterized protein n=1 Tax=Janibacter limosus TaxID=53458 RepID=A0AC61U494_9MICO|nr:hypothetical protein [Janibacter limosus]
MPPPAPPSEEDGHPEPTPSGPTVADHSGGLPPMPGSAPFVEEPDRGRPRRRPARSTGRRRGTRSRAGGP